MVWLAKTSCHIGSGVRGMESMLSVKLTASILLGSVLDSKMRVVPGESVVGDEVSLSSDCDLCDATGATENFHNIDRRIVLVLTSDGIGH